VLTDVGFLEMTSQTISVHRLKLAILPLDSACSGLVLHLRELLFTGNSHKKQPERLLTNYDSEMKKVPRFKYKIWNVRGLVEREEWVDNFMENKSKLQ
jgi:hypothetical protein